MSSLKWTSLKVVYDKILRDPLFIGLSYESVVDYFIDFINIVGAPDLFDEKITDPALTISNYRAKLPDDFVEEIQLNINKRVARHSSDTFVNFYNVVENLKSTQYYGYNLFNKYDGSNIKGATINSDGSISTNDNWDFTVTHKIPVIPSTTYCYNSAYNIVVAEYDSSNVFYKSTSKVPSSTITTSASTHYIKIQVITTEVPGFKFELGAVTSSYSDYVNTGFNDIIKDPIEMTYSIKGDYIYTSVKDGDMLLTYKSIKTQDDVNSDDYGYPMMIDDSVFILALKSYIEVEFLRMLFRVGKVTNQVLEEAKQSYAWNVGRYETHSRRLTLGKMETLSKLFRFVQTKNNEFNTRFKNLGTN